MKSLFIKLIPNRLLAAIKCIRDQYIDSFCVKSYSQEGEDMVLRRIFENQTVGFYVDVGAHHPYRFSNTYFFYRLGWRGINIEPNPEAISAFRSARPRDINLELGVSDCPGQLTYYQFDEPALNTFDYGVVKAKLAKTSYKLKTASEVSVERLDAILAKQLPENTKIDFLSIDVEGLDYMVLKSNDWDTYRPKCVLAELVNATIEDVMKSEIYQFMENQNYKLFAKTHNTLIFLCE